MPNPIAHPAAAIPFTKLKLIFLPLVIGSIVPDFGYLVHGGGDFMYTLPGLFFFDLPVGLLVLWLVDTFAKWPLLSLLPIGLQRRLYDRARDFSFGPWKHFGVILLSLLVGSITHILWDSFTHDFGWVVQHVPFFSIPVGGTPLYDILQTLSTIVGTVLLIYWFFRWLPRATRSEHIPAHFPARVQAIFLVLTGFSLFLSIGLSLYSKFILGSYTHMVVLAFLLTFFFIGAYCLAWMIAFHGTLRRVPRS